MSSKSIIETNAPLILAEIKKAKRVLLHCHPSPDPDSLGSALALKFALEQIGKSVTLIRGDSEIPRGYRNFPGVAEVVPKHFGEIDLKEFDLFVSVDSAVPEQISRYKTPVFPLPIKTIVIDHHKTNKGYGELNLIDASYPATAQILYELFKIWNLKIDKDIARNLFVGMYTDTGGFKYNSTVPGTIFAAAELATIVPDYHSLISDIENSNSAQFMKYEGLALCGIETFHGGRLAISVVPLDLLQKNNIAEGDVRASEVSSFMRTVPEWKVCVAMAEASPGRIRVSSRTLHHEGVDVSSLMESIGGGGHKAAAAAIVVGKSLDEVKNILVAKAKELYNL